MQHVCVCVCVCVCVHACVFKVYVVSGECCTSSVGVCVMCVCVCVTDHIKRLGHLYSSQ